MENKTYKHHNAEAVLEKLDFYIERGCSIPMRQVYDDLSIFDWWTETLSVSKMKQMKSFIENAIRLGYKGYVCFKVGASGCANGMWASTEESKDGCSPDNGNTLYRSFSPDYTYWSANVNGKWFPENSNQAYNSCKTIKQLEELISKN